MITIGFVSIVRFIYHSLHLAEYIVRSVHVTVSILAVVIGTEELGRFSILSGL